jgi:hypothetical protein
MPVKRTPLTQAEFDNLRSASDWTIHEIDLDTIKATRGVERSKDIIGAFASGDATITKRLNDQDANFGMDVIVHESNPMRSRGEGDVNVYHYVIKRTGRVDYPFLMFGPYEDETLIGHWPTQLDVEVYFKQNP